MSAYLPTRGSSMTMFADRFVSSSFGFALGWLYWYVRWSQHCIITLLTQAKVLSRYPGAVRDYRSRSGHRVLGVHHQHRRLDFDHAGSYCRTESPTSQVLRRGGVLVRW